MLAKYYVMIITMVLVVGSSIWTPLPTNTFAQPTWETYEDEDCEIAIDHQYEDDIIDSNAVNEFSIISMGEPAHHVPLSTTRHRSAVRPG